MNISILDDHKLFSELLKLSLSEFDFIESIRVYNNPGIFFAHLDVLKTDLLIIDILMPEMNGLEVITKCRNTKCKKALKILVLSTVTNSNVIKDVFRSGANGYLGKDTSIKELIKAMQFINVEVDKTYVGESLKDILIQSQLFESIKFSLSPREKELLKNVCAGKTVKEISSDLDLSINTIQSYMKQLMRKMDVNRTPDLILKAIKYGLFHPDYII